MLIDAVFITKLCNNDPNCQRQLFEGYARLLLTVSRRYSPAHVDPLDNMHDAFIKIFQKISLFDANKGTFDAWAKRIVINCALEKMSKKSYTHERYPEIINDTLDEINIEDKLMAEDILKLIDQLPDGYKQVFNMYEIEGYSHREISETLGIKEVSSRSNLFRAKKILQELLTNQNSQTQWMTA